MTVRRLCYAAGLVLCVGSLKIFLWNGSTAKAGAPKRLALVIGNSKYPIKPLPSPVKDAAQWKTSLESAGFAVDLCPDCTLQQMKDKLRTFKAKIAPGDEAFFYYGGHGAEENDLNLLFPVDADIQGCGTLFEQTVSLSYVLDAMAAATVKAVVLDACRSSPFPTCTMDNDPQVFIPQKNMPSGTLIAYATRRGDTAADPGQGSAYSRAVLPLAFQPGVPLYDALIEAGLRVQEATGGRQEPWVLSSLSPANYALRPAVSPVGAADTAWSMLAAMPEGATKRSAVVEFLIRHGSSGAASVQAAQEYLTREPTPGTTSGGGTPSKTSPSSAVVSPTPSPGKFGDPPAGGPTGRIYTARRGSPGELSFIGLSEGVFDMGSREGVGSGNEHPQRRVRVSAFAMGKSEVTQAQWATVVQAAQKAGDVDAKGLKTDPSSYKGASRPVERVSWCDAARFANALSRLEGKTPAYTVNADCEKGGVVARAQKADGYRLPTEAEWEYAARAGTTTAYSFGEDADQLCTYANVFDLESKKAHPDWSWENADCNDKYTETAPVCSFLPSPWGLCDVHGNVWEWTGDWYTSTYDAAEVGNPVGAASGFTRVLRGGSWGDSPDYARSADRDWRRPSSSGSYFGFRLVLPVPASEP